MTIKPYNAYEDEALDKGDNASKTVVRKNISRFLREYLQHTEVDPGDSEARLWPPDTKDVTFELVRGADRVHLGYIRSLSPQKSGAGSIALKWLCNLADKNKVVLDLVVAHHTGKNAKLSKLELAAWYRRNGFIDDPESGESSMVRFPLKSRGWPI